MGVVNRWFEQFLACPDCGGDLTLASSLACECGFQTQENSPLNLKPQSPLPRMLSFPLRDRRGALDSCDLIRPTVTYSGPRPLRDSAELLSAVLPRLRGARVLDLGCGPRDQASAFESCGSEYVGVDFSSLDADLLADAHAIPFRAGTFDVVFSYAVLEHLYNPFVAAEELSRVLKPGGLALGTVSQGEPFHDSFFHHTAFGLLSTLGHAGLQTSRLWPSYDTLHSLAVMGRYPKLQRWLIEGAHRFGTLLPIASPRKFFRWTAREKALDELHRAASICFVASKPL